MQVERGIGTGNSSVLQQAAKTTSIQAVQLNLYLPAGLAGSRARISCWRRYQSRRDLDSIDSLNSLKLATFRAPSTSSLIDLLRSDLASTDQPLNEPVFSFKVFAAASR